MISTSTNIQKCNVPFIESHILLQEAERELWPLPPEQLLKVINSIKKQFPIGTVSYLIDYLYPHTSH